MPQRVRAVLLDAVGTAIYPAEDVAVTYAEYGRREGSRLTVEEVRSRFHESFARLEELDRRNGYETSEDHEFLRWMTIVLEVMSDVPPPNLTDFSLWDHYAKPAAWRVFSDAKLFLESAACLGIDVILASNFDARLRTVVAGLQELSGLKDLAISSELGWRKPSPTFYQRILDEHRLSPAEVVAVGDDVTNDVEGARGVGITAYLLDRRGRYAGEMVVRSLEEVGAKLGETVPL